ncbi:MAG: XdhC family protein [Flavobacteriaceae bacterium]|nr:XdhC family protein [Flavobacteriaceae bacterium]
MTHELKKMVEAFITARDAGKKAVLASVVDLEGSSYRKPGVRMLIIEGGQMIGAVSGGCVEKDILRQSETVFEDGKSKMMLYDGRYRLGCEGVLYILLECFNPDKSCLDAFNQALTNRIDFTILSDYVKNEGISKGIGSSFVIKDKTYSVSGENYDQKEGAIELLQFRQDMPPCFKLMIFGTEHDAVLLCQYAALNGWEVSVVAGPLESKSIENFPGASSFFAISPDAIALERIDQETAIVLMSHNFASDLKYLIEIKDSQPAYVGLLGPAHRREKLMTQLLDYCPDITESFLGKLHGPAGLNIGAETPQEIAISILSEILTVTRDQVPLSLKEKDGGIHA